MNYLVPTITTVAGTFTELLLTGTNYGYARTFDGVNDFVLIDGQLCSVTFVNDTVISCASPVTLENQKGYNFTVSIGGQVISQQLI